MKITVEVKLILIFIVGVLVTLWVREPVNRIHRDITDEILLRNYGGFGEPTHSLPRGEGVWPEAFARALFFYTRCIGNEECTPK